MFLKTHRRRKNGRDHCYYSIAENRRTARGVVQRRVLYLGEINDSQRETWQHAIRVFDEETKAEREVAVYTSASVLPSHAEGCGVGVRLDAMELHRPRQWGACWLAAELWSQLDLDAFWSPRLGCSRAGTEVLSEMRASDPPASYLVGTPKGRLTRLEERLLKEDWQQAREGADVKLLTEEGETYVLARSQDRVHKERSMRRRRLKRYLKTLRTLRLERKRPLTRDALLQALGAAAQAAGRDAKHVLLTLPPEGSELTPESFTCQLDRDRLRRTRRREGRYLLRTNLTSTDPAELWERYLQLVQVEEAFRDLKGDLGIRPIHHQLEERVEAHVFISFMAFALHTTLRGHLRELAPGLTPRAVLEKMATLQMIDVKFPTTDGRTLTLRRHTQPHDDVQLLLNQLHLTLPEQPRPHLSAAHSIVL